MSFVEEKSNRSTLFTWEGRIEQPPQRDIGEFTSENGRETFPVAGYSS